MVIKTEKDDFVYHEMVVQSCRPQKSIFTHRLLESNTIQKHRFYLIGKSMVPLSLKWNQGRDLRKGTVTVLKVSIWLKLKTRIFILMKVIE